jgi:hypothetical protein
MITNFTHIIYPDYRRFDHCSIFRGNNNRDNRGIPVFMTRSSLLHCTALNWTSTPKIWQLLNRYGHHSGSSHQLNGFQNIPEGMKRASQYFDQMRGTCRPGNVIPSSYPAPTTLFYIFLNLINLSLYLVVRLDISLNGLLEGLSFVFGFYCLTMPPKHTCISPYYSFLTS